MLLKAMLPMLLVNFESAAAVGFKDKQSHIVATDDDDYDWNLVRTKTHSLIRVYAWYIMFGSQGSKYCRELYKI